MPLFMFISGYLLNYGLARKSIPLSKINICGRYGFVINKIKRLLIPYVFISTFAYFPKVLLSRFAARPYRGFLGGLGKNVTLSLG